ncbi:MAG: tyrosine-type recombinase/integrase [Anaerolineae bacterium]
MLRELPSGRSRSLTSDDVNRLLAAVKRGQGRWADRDKTIIYMLIGAGLKLGELIELRLSDVDLESSEPCLYIRDIDGNPGRVVPLDREVSETLRDYLSTRSAMSSTDYLYTNRDGRPLSPRSVQRLLNRYAQAAGLEKLTTQALRYIYARRVYEKSKSLKTVAHLLGHRHLATTIRYLRPGPLRGDQLLADDPTE